VSLQYQKSIQSDYTFLLCLLFITYINGLFQRQVFSALSQIAKHSVDLAEMVVEAEIFPAVLTCLRDADEYVRKNVATLIREIAKHTPEVIICLIINAYIIVRMRVQVKNLQKCSSKLTTFLIRAFVP